MATRLAEFATEVHALLNDATVKKCDDVASLQRHEVRRRITWLTPGGTTEPPRQAGGRAPSDGTAYRIQACRIRVEHIDAHIFAESREMTERLLDNVIAASCTVARVLEIPSYRWETEERENSGKVLRAHECILRINLRLPVPEQILPLVAITSQDHECGTLQDDGTIVSQDDTP